MATIKRHASAEWLGTGKDGKGSLTTQSATLSMEQEAGGWKIAAVHLMLRAVVPGIDPDKFQEVVAAAKAGCPVSKVLNATITLDARLE